MASREHYIIQGGWHEGWDWCEGWRSDLGRWRSGQPQRDHRRL